MLGLLYFLVLGICVNLAWSVIMIIDEKERRKELKNDQDVFVHHE